MMKFDKIQNFISSFGLLAIGIFSFGYVVFYIYFAELHIQLPFLDFPIFVGEILLFICLMLFFAKYLSDPKKLNKWHYILITYFIFVVAKALYGYAQWGPLAFRNAALLYYPLLIILGYAFYRRSFFDNKKIMLLFSMIILLFVTNTYYSYWVLTCFLLGFILVRSYPHRNVKYVMLAMLLIFMPYKLLFFTARMMLVSNIITGLYLVAAFCIISRITRKTKILLILLTAVFIVFGVANFSQLTRVKTILSFQDLIRTFNSFDQRVQAKIDHFEMGKLDNVMVYKSEEGLQTYETPFSEYKARQEEKMAKLKEEKSINLAKKKRSASTTRRSSRKASGMQDVAEIEVEEAIEEVLAIEEKDAESIIEDEPITEYPASRGLNNAVFRLLIWRDMIVEMAKEKPILGFDFGKPLRSVSLEILYWGWNNWGLLGWVPAHNSYLHIIYRTGLVGILFIGTVFILLFKMIRKFIQWKSIPGILLCGIIINWFIAANFLLTFELPYTAVPIWSLYGMTFAYYKEQEKLRHELDK